MFEYKNPSSENFTDKASQMANNYFSKPQFTRKEVSSDTAFGKVQAYLNADNILPAMHAISFGVLIAPFAIGLFAKKTINKASEIINNYGVNKENVENEENKVTKVADNVLNAEENLNSAFREIDSNLSYGPPPTTGYTYYLNGTREEVEKKLLEKFPGVKLGDSQQYTLGDSQQITLQEIYVNNKNFIVCFIHKDYASKLLSLKKLEAEPKVESQVTPSVEKEPKANRKAQKEQSTVESKLTIDKWGRPKLLGQPQNTIKKEDFGDFVEMDLG